MKEFLATRIDPYEEAGDEVEENQKEDKWVKEEEKEDYDEDKWVKQEEQEEEKGDHDEEKWVTEEKDEEEKEDYYEDRENDFLLPDTFLSPPLGDVVVGEIFTLPS